MRFALLCGLFASSGTFASIDKPAGTVPPVSDAAYAAGGMPIGVAKSKVIPLPDKLTRESAAEAFSRSGIDPSAASKGKVPESAPKIVSRYAGESRVAAEGASPPDQAVVPGQEWTNVARKLEQEDPAQSVTKGQRVEDIIEPTSEYQYSPGRRKNPFLPNIVRSAAQGRKELNPNDVEIPIINPLQSFGLGQLAVIGVWEGDDHVWKALIQTPTNQGIETKLGDPAGNSGGRIMSISPDAVIVREFKVRSDGTREYKDVPLYMGSDKNMEENNSAGGRVILRPGATAPEIERPDSTVVPDTPQTQIVPTERPGVLATKVPAKDIKESPAIVPDAKFPVIPEGGAYEQNTAH